LSAFLLPAFLSAFLSAFFLSAFFCLVFAIVSRFRVHDPPARRPHGRRKGVPASVAASPACPVGNDPPTAPGLIATGQASPPRLCQSGLGACLCHAFHGLYPRAMPVSCRVVRTGRLLRRQRFPHCPR
jgi:hypothetical protein